MSDITSGVSSILTMLGSVLDFIIDQPILLVLCLIPLVGGLIFLITSIFRK